jgi:hypothetical protein
MNLSSLLFPGSRVAIVGSRDFPQPSLVESFVADLDDVVVISGAGGVVDVTAVSSARLFGIEVIEFPADWDRYRRGAGPVRNSVLVNSGLDVLVAFASDPRRLSPGTSDVVRKALSAGVPVFVFGPDGSEISKRCKSLQMQLF